MSDPPQNPMVAIPRNEMLLLFSQWIRVSESTQNPTRYCGAQINYDCYAPLKLREHGGTLESATGESCGNFSVSMIRIENPMCLPAASKRRLEAAVMPYVCRAFGQHPATLDPQIMQEHCDHLIPGDVLFLAVIVKVEESKTRSTDRPIPTAPWIVAQLLVSTVGGIRLEDSSNSKTHTAMCIVGRVCDPALQRKGISTWMQKVALNTIVPDMIVTRTANPAILKLLRRAKIGARLYPNDCNSMDDWNKARIVGNQIVAKWNHLAVNRAVYDAERLVFRHAYSDVNQEVFGQDRNSEDQPLSLQPGDAVLRILIL